MCCNSSSVNLKVEVFATMFDMSALLRYLILLCWTRSSCVKVAKMGVSFRLYLCLLPVSDIYQGCSLYLSARPMAPITHN